MGICKKVLGKLESYYIKITRWIYCKINRLRLKNNNFSIISKNCVGGMIMEDLHLPFTSPTAGISIPSPDFIRMCENLKEYMNMEIVELEDNSVKYPVGLLGDVRLDFMHCKTFQEAVEKWERRKKRINYDNLFFCMVERDDCNEELLERFSRLECKNKVWFTHLDRKNDFCVYIPGYEKTGLGNLLDFTGWNRKRIYETNFDPIKWLNRK